MAIAQVDVPDTSDPVDAATYDELLGPLLWSAAGTAQEVLLALMVRAIELGKPSNELRQWCLRSGAGRGRGAQLAAATERHGTPEEAWSHSVSGADTKTPSLMSLVSSSKSWSDLWDRAERKVLSSPSDTGDDSPDSRKDELKVAEALVAGLLLPLPWGGATQKRSYSDNKGMRVAFAAVALSSLGNKRWWDSVFMSRPALIRDVGWGSVETAGKHLKALTVAGLLKRRAAGYGKYRIRQIDKDSRARINEYRDTVDALISGGRDPVAMVMRSLTHPAWGYSSVLSHGHWLTLLAYVADVPPERYGISNKTLTEVNKGLSAAGLNEDTVPLLQQILDEIAGDPESGLIDKETGQRISAFEASARANQKWAESAAIRVQEVAELRETKRAAFVAEQERRAVEKAERSEKRAKRRSERDEEEQSKLAPALEPAPEPEHLMLRLMREEPVPKAPPAEREVTKDESMALLLWINTMRGMVPRLSLDEELRESSRPILHQAMKDAGYGDMATADLAAHILDGADLPPKLVNYLKTAIEVEPVF